MLKTSPPDLNCEIFGNLSLTFVWSSNTDAQESQQQGDAQLWTLRCIFLLQWLHQHFIVNRRERSGKGDIDSIFLWNNVWVLLISPLYLGSSAQRGGDHWVRYIESVARSQAQSFAVARSPQRRFSHHRHRHHARIRKTASGCWPHLQHRSQALVPRK